MTINNNKIAEAKKAVTVIWQEMTDTIFRVFETYEDAERNYNVSADYDCVEWFETLDEGCRANYIKFVDVKIPVSENGYIFVMPVD